MSDYVFLNDLSRKFMSEDGSYLVAGQTAEERFEVIGETAERILDIPGYKDKFLSYLKKGWFSISTPVLTNFGTDRGLPISCFGSYIDDTMESILYTLAEVGMMTKFGGGTSAYAGKLRSRGAEIKDNGKSSGAVHFLHPYNTLINIVSQGTARRGSFAAYLPVRHKDIDEFLTIRNDGSPLQDILFGVTVDDEWMEEMIAGDHEKRVRWAKILEKRLNTGLPYIVFIDNANNGRPDIYKELELEINQSNLCTEIFLPNQADESFVCDLSSVNLFYYDEWKDTDLIEVVIFLLDAVMTEFIEKARKVPFMDRAVKFAERHRALGLGAFGWHSYLQSHMIAFESMNAKYKNVEIFKHIRKEADAASRKLAQLFGEPEILKGKGERNTTKLAIAPTKSTAFIFGQMSEAVELFRSNIEVKDLAKMKVVIRNRFLERLLEEKGFNTDEVWDSIMKAGGSVQHLSFLSREEKDVFKTFGEVSQKEIIIQAAQRQKYIDQGQSINLMIHPSTPPQEINRLYIDAWELGLKSLYYQYNVNAAQEFSKNLLNCKSCEA